MAAGLPTVFPSGSIPVIQVRRLVIPPFDRQGVVFRERDRVPLLQDFTLLRDERFA